MKKISVEKEIRTLANSSIESFAPKFNLSTFREGGKRHSEYKAMQHHKEICEEITAFADSHREIPFYFVLQVGVSKGAYKHSAFDKGYRAFDAEKVLAVYAFGEAYKKHNGVAEKQLGDVGIRLMMRHYEKVSQDISVFKKNLKGSQIFGESCMNRVLPYEVLCENLNIPYNGEGRNGNGNVA